jgi:protein-disulfide isomerase
MSRQPDLAVPVNAVDHALGAEHSPVTVVEYGDFECPTCKQAAPAVKLVLDRFANRIRFVFRHFPVEAAHPHALHAAQAAEAAGGQGKFWQMHDLLLANQENLEIDDLIGYAARLGLDLTRFRADLLRHPHAARVANDVDSADRSGVAGTPTFFINERRHDGPQDLATLTKAIGEARAQADAFSGAARHDSGREEGPDGDAPIRSGSIPVSHGAVSPALGPVPAIYVPSPKDPR